MQRQGSKESQNRRVDHTHDPDGIVHDHKEHNTTASLRMFRMAFPKELYASKFWAAAMDGMHSLQNDRQVYSCVTPYP